VLPYAPDNPVQLLASGLLNQRHVTMPRARILEPKFYSIVSLLQSGDWNMPRLQASSLLSDFERSVIVLSVLKKYSDQECATLSGISLQELREYPRSCSSELCGIRATRRCGDHRFVSRRSRRNVTMSAFSLGPKTRER
jgi:hypothetical protein